MKISKKLRISNPAVSRLCKMYSILEELKAEGESTVSSKYIGMRLGVGSHTIRKDINYLGETGTVGAGYNIAKLQSFIERSLGLKTDRNACVIGFNELGTAILNNKFLPGSSFKIVAGFDSNINRLETIRTDIPVYPTHEIVERARKIGIDLAVIAEPENNAHTIAERLIEGGVMGIVNLSPVILSSSAENVFIRNVDLAGEFRLLSALLTIRNEF